MWYNPLAKPNVDTFNKDKPIWNVSHRGAWALNGFMYGATTWELLGIFLTKEDMHKFAGSLSVLEYEAIHGQFMEFNKPLVLESVAYKRGKTWMP